MWLHWTTLPQQAVLGTFPSPLRTYLPSKLINHTDALKVLGTEMRTEGMKTILLLREPGFMFVLCLHLPLLRCDTKKISAADSGLHKPRDYVLPILTGPFTYSLANTTTVVSSLRYSASILFLHQPVPLCPSDKAGRAALLGKDAKIFPSSAPSYFNLLFQLASHQSQVNIYPFSVLSWLVFNNNFSFVL